VTYGKQWNPFSAGALPWTPLGELRTLSRTPSRLERGNFFLFPRDSPPPRTFALVAKVDSRPTLSWKPKYAPGLGVLRLREKPNRRFSKLSKHRPTHRVIYHWNISTRCILWCLKITEIRFRKGLRPRPRCMSSRHFHRPSSWLGRGSWASSRYVRYGKLPYHFWKW